MQLIEIEERGKQKLSERSEVFDQGKAGVRTLSRFLFAFRRYAPHSTTHVLRVKERRERHKKTAARHEKVCCTTSKEEGRGLNHSGSLGTSLFLIVCPLSNAVLRNLKSLSRACLRDGRRGSGTAATASAAAATTRPSSSAASAPSTGFALARGGGGGDGGRCCCCVTHVWSVVDGVRRRATLASRRRVVVE